MKVQDIMTREPACCDPQTSLQKVARTMTECDCGEIPVVDNMTALMPIGVITDRDIVCRTIAEGKNPLEMTVKQVMSQPPITVRPETSLEECVRIMEDNQIRRIPVVDGSGKLTGIVSQADIARHAPKEKAGEVVSQVSQPTYATSYK